MSSAVRDILTLQKDLTLTWWCCEAWNRLLWVRQSQRQLTFLSSLWRWKEKKIQRLILTVVLAENKMSWFFWFYYFDLCFKGAQPSVPEGSDWYLYEGECGWQSESHSCLSLDRRFTDPTKAVVRTSLTHFRTQAAPVKTAHLPLPCRGRKEDGVVIKKEWNRHTMDSCV